MGWRRVLALTLGWLLAWGLGSGVAARALDDASTDVALFDPATGEWHLRQADGSDVRFYYGTPGDLPLLGDWDCDGVDTVAMFRPSNGFVYLRNSNTFGVADRDFFYGLGGDIPLAGDWNGDGCDTLAIYRPGEGKVYIRNSLGTGAADFDFFFGNPGDRPFAGDFDGDGVTTVGLYRESTGFVYFRNTLATGVADFQFFYGEPSDRIVAGDWDENGTYTVGIFRPGDARFYLSNENALQLADVVVPFGKGGIVVQDESGALHAWNNQLPAAWRATSVDWLPVAGEFAAGSVTTTASTRGLGLVARVGDEVESRIETCTYTPYGTIYRYRWELTATLYEAGTTDVVATRELSGSAPESCPWTAWFDSSNPVKYYHGGHVTVSDFQEWVAGYVDGT